MTYFVLALYDHTRELQITTIILLRLLYPQNYTQNALSIILLSEENITYSLSLKNTFQTLRLKPSGLKGIFYPSEICHISHR